MLINFWQHPCSSLLFCLGIFFKHLLLFSYNTVAKSKWDFSRSPLPQPESYHSDFCDCVWEKEILPEPPAPVKINCFKAEQRLPQFNNKLSESDISHLISGRNLIFSQSFPQGKGEQCVLEVLIAKVLVRTLIFLQRAVESCFRRWFSLTCPKKC